MIKESTLTILKQLNDEVVPAIHDVYKTRKHATKEEDIWPITGENADNELGRFTFLEKGDGTYFRLEPNHPGLREKFCLHKEGGIDSQWLLPFTYEEMRVENGVFKAVTSIWEAKTRVFNMPTYAENNKRHTGMERLFGVSHQNMLNMGMTNMLHEDEFIRFLLDGHVVNMERDYVLLEMQYEEGVAEQTIKQHINEQVKTQKRQVKIPHWDKQ